jgi:hypothetical protein
MIRTVSSLALDLDPASSFASLSIVLLITLLMIKELALSREGTWQNVGRFVNVAILPLLFVFVSIMLVRIANILN